MTPPSYFLALIDKKNSLPSVYSFFALSKHSFNTCIHSASSSIHQQPGLPSGTAKTLSMVYKGHCEMSIVVAPLPPQKYHNGGLAQGGPYFKTFISDNVIGRLCKIMIWQHLITFYSYIFHFY